MRRKLIIELESCEGCHIREMINTGYVEHTQPIVLYIETMAMFQEWVHGKDYWNSLMSIPVFDPPNKS